METGISPSFLHEESNRKSYFSPLALLIIIDSVEDTLGHNNLLTHDLIQIFLFDGCSGALCIHKVRHIVIKLSGPIRTIPG